MLPRLFSRDDCWIFHRESVQRGEKAGEDDVDDDASGEDDADQGGTPGDALIVEVFDVGFEVVFDFVEFLAEFGDVGFEFGSEVFDVGFEVVFDFVEFLAEFGDFFD